MGPNRISLRAQAAREAFLVLSEIHYPGWRVTVDGHARPLLRADYLLRAVRVPAGEHQIEFTFAPPALLWGGALSAAGLIACCGLLVAWAWRGRRVGQGG